MNCSNVIEEIKQVIIGKDDVIEKVLMAILAQGHILIEDIPGVGKTTLALAFSKTLDLKYNRIQFTPDTMPSDITGFSIYSKKTEEFTYKEGAIMANMVLADEINRTSSKTQSALLEAMEEKRVTVDSTTYQLPNPFVVIATQNPIQFSGTHLLPISQLDRFIIRIKMGYPDVKSEINLLRDRQCEQPLDKLKGILTSDKLIELQQKVKEVYISDYILEYITDLINATRNHEYIELGISPRGALALSRIAKARAYLKQRDYVIPEDILTIFQDVCAHRILLNMKGKTQGIEVVDLLEHIINTIPIPVVEVKK